MKKLGILTLIALLSLNLAACGGDSAKEEPQKETVVEEKEEQKKDEEEETQEEEKEEEIVSEEEESTEPVLLDTENVKITYTESFIYNWGNENEFSFFFDVENRTGNDLTVTATEFVLDGYNVGYGYMSFAATASSTTNGRIGYADHDDQGMPAYDEWLAQESENGVRELKITLTVTDAAGNQIEQPSSVIIDVKNGTIKK